MNQKDIHYLRRMRAKVKCFLCSHMTVPPYALQAIAVGAQTCPSCELEGVNCFQMADGRVVLRCTYCGFQWLYQMQLMRWDGLWQPYDPTYEPQQSEELADCDT